MLLVAFVLVERRAVEPILPLWVFRHRILAGGNLVGLGVGALMIGLTSYVPTYAEGVLGTGALVAGFALAALTIGWPLAATFSGRLYMRIGFRDTGLIGATVVVAGAVLCALISQNSGVWQIAAVCFIVGAGLGLSASPTMVAIQSVVGWERRGVVTATQMFCRSIGSAGGAAVFGAISNGTLADRFAHPPGSVAGRLPNSVDATSLVLGAQGAAAQSPTAVFVRKALYDASHHVFLALVVVAVLSVGALLLMPRHTEQLTFD